LPVIKLIWRVLVAKPEWGNKRNCQACGAKFYDMRRDPAVCPSCGTAFDPNTSQRARRSRATPAASKAPPPPKPKAENEELSDLEDEDLDIAVDDEGDDVLVDTEDLDAADGDDEIPGVAVGGEDDEST
jgi:uncharacterized protein (TIGR02300 family)